jgi:P4 family phage/plasmid primase-like protien
MKATTNGIDRFTHGATCPVCGGTEDEDPRGNGTRCHGFIGDGYIHCTREEFASGCKFHTGSQTYSHRLKGKCRCGTKHNPGDVPNGKPKTAKAKKPKTLVDFAHPVAIYPYEEPDGSAVRFQVRRLNVLDPAGKVVDKSFRPYRPSGKGGWLLGMGQVETIPYRLPQLLAADPDEPVWICEGEKDVDNLRALGLVATCNPGGAGKWLDRYSEFLRGRTCHVPPDNDRAGREHAQQVAQSLQGVAAGVKVVELPGLPPKGDVSDFLATGGTVDQLDDLAHETPEWKPSGGGTGPQVEQVKVYESADDPHRLGRLFLKSREIDGKPTVVYHRGEFHVWEGSAYRPLPDHEVNASVVSLVKREFDRLNPLDVKAWEKRGCKDRKGMECPPPVVRKVGTRLTGDIAQALRGETLLPGTVDPPAWLIDNPPFPASDVLPTANALVHLPSFVEEKAGAIAKPTPGFFCPYALDYGFDADAETPVAWAQFLASVWPDDVEAIETLQEWLGYLLTLDTSHQKIGLFIGPRRSGRGTISRLISKLIGAANVASPTFSGLASHFGASCLIGKPVAIVGDARQSKKSDWAIALERLLMISGEDAIEIDRKNRPSWTGRLPTRITLISNELPTFLDQSGALASRFLLLRFTESFLGKEDKQLDAKLHAELPGILLWAIEGWKRLRARGHFLQPKSGQGLIDQFRDYSSPVGAFVREMCEVKAGNVIQRSDLFQAWRDWCIEKNREPGTADAFGRSLWTTCPHLGTTQPRDAQGKKYRAYEGIKLKPGPVY